MFRLPGAAGLRCTHTAWCLRTLMVLVLALGVSAGAPSAHAQFSCGAAIDPTILTPPDSGMSYFVGSAITMNVEVKVGDIQGGEFIEVTSVLHALDCFDDGILEMCTDEGPLIRYNGDAFLSTDCPGLDITSDMPAGGTMPNVVTFTFDPPLMLQADTGCNVTFDVTIEQPPEPDMTPDRIESASGFDGMCDNGLLGLARGTSAIMVDYCGDNAVNTPDETCDGSSAKNCSDAEGCRPPGDPNECTCCGDGTIQKGSGETCDDGNDIDDDDCRNDCTFCGDGILQPEAGEICDEGDNNSDEPNATCRTNCLPSECGDDIVDTDLGETCDGTSHDACTDDDGCRLPGDTDACTCCGDGVLQETSGETCDDGNEVDDDDCRNDCTFCGDGIPQAPEQCDDGNDIDDDGCRNNCTIRVCGDGVIDDGETCDGDNAPGCNEACRPPEFRFMCTCCGDGVLQMEAGETCDDGNSVDDDDCRNDCSFCGDGNLDPGEKCDAGDMNADTPDAPCRSDCTLPVCGDNIIDPGMDETCDGTDADNCNELGCRIKGDIDECTCCGDGIVQEMSNETCDDGNDIDDDDCRNDCTFCGDGVVQMEAGELCDEGENNSDDPNAMCRTNCVPPECGDGIADTEFGEFCDGVDATGCNDACRGPERINPCTCCGDGVTQVDDGEACDDGNMIDDDDCRNDCTFCGDGVVQPGEECDDGDDNGTGPDQCRPDCKNPVCGDGIVDSDEACDDGNMIDDDECRNDCTFCGDGVVQPGEECDDGDNNGTGPDQCRPDCKNPVCGDGIVDSDEACDDGNMVDDDECRNDCTFCGDGEVQMDAGETCDDGNDIDDDACRNDCTFCGDGMVQPGEECDDGDNNGTGPDQCRPDCKNPVCGDGIVDSDEACDDGNMDDDDECRNDCTFCGDGEVQMDAGETCDDGNDNDFDDCRNDCTFCGDGMVQPGEECDEGDNNSNEPNATCRTDCTPGACGDGILDDQQGETCDGADAPGCNGPCRPVGGPDPCTCCGDGIVQDSEECDDGNSNNNDDCSNACSIPSFCGDGIIDPKMGETCDGTNAPGCFLGICRPPGDLYECTCCGDGEIQGQEQCDGADNCSEQCTTVNFVSCCLGDGRCIENVSAGECFDQVGGIVEECLGDSNGDGVDDACVPAVPTVTTIGMAVLALILMLALALKFRRRDEISA